jgi:hypothetical protein
MTLDEIDRALAEWRDRLRCVDENLLALEDEPTCKMLERATLSGSTRTRVEPALAAMRELFQQRTLLQDTIGQARALRDRVGRGPLPAMMLPSRRSLLEIEHLLRGRSIRLPRLRTPLAQRGLLSGAEREDTISPEDLLAAMLAAFEGARDAVLAVDHAWARLYPVVDVVEREVAALEALARALGEPFPDELAAARAEVVALRARVDGDPLADEATLDHGLLPRLQHVRAELEAVGAQQEQAAAEWARARALLQELREAHAAAEAAFVRCRREIEDAAGLTPPGNGLDEGLAAWLNRLEAALEAGHVRAARVGLARWLAEADRQLATERAALAASAAPLAAREELLGRLSARRAQLRALMARGVALDPALEGRGLELEALLRRRPTPLARGVRLAEEYEAQLAAAMRQRIG